jgi:hypothetical protein
MAAVARAYLGPAVRPESFVVVAGEDSSHTAEASQQLQRAAASMGLTSMLLRRQSESVDLELGREVRPTLVIYDHGGSVVADAAHLPDPPARGADLLLWCPRPGRGPRWIYLLSLWVCSLQPRQIRCVVGPDSIDGFDLSALRYRLCKGMRRAGVGEGAELLLRPAPRDGDRMTRFYAQILQGLLSDSAKSGRKRRRLFGRRVAAAVVAAVGFFTALGLGAARAEESAATPTALLEFVDFDEARDTALEAPGGSVLYHGPAYAVRAAGGVGFWSQDGHDFTVAARRDQTHFELDGQALEWGSGSHRIRRNFAAHAPEFSVVLSRGRVEMLPDQVVVHPVLGSNKLMGRGGVFVSVVLAGIIFFLMWRANYLQRRLDAPRHSMRHGHSPSDRGAADS